MEEHLLENDLMSLISEKQREIRRKCQEEWNEQYDVSVPDSEWTVLGNAARESMTVSEMAKRLSISRQASHKIVRSLEKKGFVIMIDGEHYKNRKYIFLTKEGLYYNGLYRNMKENLVQEIEDNIGMEKSIMLREVLSKDWGLRA